MNNNTYIEYDTEQMEMMSLYDYLGRAAGSRLGKQVYEEVQSKDIVTKYYNGPVLLYPTSFLKEYFKDNKK